MPAKRLRSRYGLEHHGILNVRKEHWNHNTPMLYEDAVKNREGNLVHLGPLVVRTGLHTGRAAHDKFIVEEESSKDKVWWGKINHPFTPRAFDTMFLRLQAYLQDRDVWIQDCFAGYDPRYRVPVRVVTTAAWHSRFARNMFMQAGQTNTIFLTASNIKTTATTNAATTMEIKFNMVLPPGVLSGQSWSLTKGFR